MRRFNAWLLTFDQMGPDVKFNIRGEETHQTWLGLMFSVIIMVLTSLYAYFQFNSLIGYGSTLE